MAKVASCGIHIADVLGRPVTEIPPGQNLAILEEIKTLPFGAVWDYYCEQHNVPVGLAWLDDVKQYENDVLSKR